MNNVNLINPFPNFCYSIGMIPTSYKESLTYEEQLIWFCDFLENTVIPTVNNNGQAVTELQNLYVELKSYVDNYFDNLNIQSEINNKLDEMAINGTLTNLIKNYIDPINENFQNNITNQVNNLQQQINVNSGRIDEFTSLPEGSTEGNAELVDIRVGYNGVTYNNAGNSVRNQIINIYDLIKQFTNFQDNLWIYGDLSKSASTGTYNQISKLLNLEPNTRYTLLIGNTSGNYKDNGAVQIYNGNDSSYNTGFFLNSSNKITFLTDNTGVVTIHFFVNTTTTLNELTQVTWSNIVLVKGTIINDYLKIYYDNLPNNAQTNLKLVPSKFVERSSLSSNTQLLLSSTNIKTAHIISASQHFTNFDKTQIFTGASVNAFGKMRITVDNTKVSLEQYTTQWETLNEYTHNLNITDYLNISINVLDNRTAKLTVGTTNKVFTTNILWNYPGATDIALISTHNSTNVKLFFMPLNMLNKKVWAFGDSYFDIWPWIANSYGANKWIIDGFGGRTSQQALTSVQRSLQYGNPSIIFWCLGMNNPDSSSSINADYLSVLNTLKTLCDTNNIILIPTTIPNTPTNNNEFKNEYIRNNFDRYIDIANCVGSDDNVNWYDGLLSGDNLHPTELGGRIIADKVITELPEIL